MIPNIIWNAVRFYLRHGCFCFLLYTLIELTKSVIFLFTSPFTFINTPSYFSISLFSSIRDLCWYVLSFPLEIGCLYWVSERMIGNTPKLSSLFQFYTNPSQFFRCLALGLLFRLPYELIVFFLYERPQWVAIVMFLGALYLMLTKYHVIFGMQYRFFTSIKMAIATMRKNYIKLLAVAFIVFLFMLVIAAMRDLILRFVPFMQFYYLAHLLLSTCMIAVARSFLAPCETAFANEVLRPRTLPECPKQKAVDADAEGHMEPDADLEDRREDASSEEAIRLEQDFDAFRRLPPLRFDYSISLKSLKNVSPYKLLHTQSVFPFLQMDEGLRSHMSASYKKALYVYQCFTNEGKVGSSFRKFRINGNNCSLRLSLSRPVESDSYIIEVSLFFNAKDDS